MRKHAQERVDLGSGAVAHRQNNLDALRLVGALTVILGHCYPLLGRPSVTVGGYFLQTVGVVIFFSISGYLITASWTRNANPVTFVLARSLRIFPALIALVLVTVFVLGPLTTTLTTEQYFDDPRTWSYLHNMRLLLQYDLPGVWVDLTYPNAVNGSLWTLGPEVACYLAVPVLCLLPGRIRWIGFAAALWWTIDYSYRPPEEADVIYNMFVIHASSLWAFFAAGALLRLAHVRWRGLFRADVAVGVAALYLVVIAMYPQHIGRLAWAFLPYVVLTIGLASTPVVRRASRFGDLSYGLYLWAFPVQQLVVDLWGVQRLAVNLPLVLVLTAIPAWLSWHLVEHPSLKLKELLVRKLSRRRRPEPVPDPAPDREPQHSANAS